MAGKLVGRKAASRFFPKMALKHAGLYRGQLGLARKEGNILDQENIRKSEVTFGKQKYA